MTTTQRSPTSDSLRKFARRVAGPLAALASISTVLIMIAIVIDVVARNTGGSSVPGLLSMSESALVATVFLGIAYAGATNSHVAVDLLTERLPNAVARWLVLAMWVLVVLMTTWFIIGTVERAIDSTQSNEVRAGLVDWPVWPARWLIVVGFVAFLVVAVVNVILLARGESLMGEQEVTSDETQTSASDWSARDGRSGGHAPIIEGPGTEGSTR